MRRFRDISIRRKLTLVMLFTSTVTLVLGGAFAIAYEVLRARRATVQELATQAEIIGANSAAALLFSDRPAAREILRALEVRPEIIYAGLFTPDGQPFAESADGPGKRKFTPPPNHTQPGYQFDQEEIGVFRPIKFGEDTVGVIYLRADLRQLRTLVIGYTGIAVVVGLVLLLVCWLLSTRLQRVIADPILRLANVAHGVTTRQDYTLRATKAGADEIGVLTDGFNRMLDSIQESDAKLHRAYENLRASEERFRQLAENIKQVFWLTDLQKTEMLYISPGYEQVWGRSCASLYQSARAWVDAIHPEDRERVRQAALSKQLTGDYDEEYRIVVPDGTIRWIRDRAFPIYNDHGEVYRVAGLAEDITERKRLEQEILQISEHEQSRIGQDLHDGLCQHLVSTAFTVTMLQELLAKKALPHAADVAAIGKLVDEAITQARTLARGLYPASLQREGLNFALEHLVETISRRFDTDCHLDCPTDVHLKDTTMATHLYRIAQEAINNAVKHGHATQIIVRLHTTPQQLTLAVEDNGVGLEPARPRQTGMGLNIMHYRARAIGGALEIIPRDKDRTIVRCTCPWQAA